METSIVLIHTVGLLIDTFNQLGSDILPGAKMYHVLDEVMVKRVNQNGGVDEQERAWLKQKVSNAEEIGASAVLVTCTILSACVDEVRSYAHIPIIKIDEVMSQQAVALGQHIGLLVTNPDTVEPTTRMIQDYASSVNKQVTIIPCIVEGAFDAVRRGDGETHDRLVKRAVSEIAPNVDVIILAQASMARVLENWDISERPVPILSSPYLALQQLKEVLSHNHAG